tara:strand:- start:156 stop:290 length:135 start_codon:yes stop_codon:yes gene_type:complete
MLADQLFQQINAPSDAESRVAIETAKDNWLRRAGLSVADLFFEG